MKYLQKKTCFCVPIIFFLAALLLGCDTLPQESAVSTPAKATMTREQPTFIPTPSATGTKSATPTTAIKKYIPTTKPSPTISQNRFPERYIAKPEIYSSCTAPPSRTQKVKPVSTEALIEEAKEFALTVVPEGHMHNSPIVRIIPHPSKSETLFIEYHMTQFSAHPQTMETLILRRDKNKWKVFYHKVGNIGCPARWKAVFVGFIGECNSLFMRVKVYETVCACACGLYDDLLLRVE